MRRQDLALSPQATTKLIAERRYAALCLIDPAGKPYGVPMDYIFRDGFLFFHGAKEGRKVDCMRKNPYACAVIIGDTEVVPQKFGRKYESAIVEGAVEIIDDPGLKRQVMTWVVENNSAEYMEKGEMVIEKMLDRVLVYKMSIDTATGKHGI